MPKEPKQYPAGRFLGMRKKGGRIFLPHYDKMGKIFKPLQILGRKK